MYLLLSLPARKIDKTGLKALSHDPILRIRFLVPKIGSRRSYGQIRSQGSVFVARMSEGHL